MKKLVLVIGLSFLIQHVHGQILDGDFISKKGKSVLPRKFVWVEKDRVAMKESEVTIGEYLFFMENISSTNNVLADNTTIAEDFFIPKAPCILADFVLKPENRISGASIPWFDQKAFNAKYNVDPKNQKAYSIYEHPITGLTYEQANGYARWCTAYIGDYYKVTGKNSNLIFRLPYAAEFQKYAAQGMTQCYDKKKPADKEKFIQQIRDCKNDKKCALCNYANKEVCESNTRLTNQFGTALYPVRVFFPNCFGAYDLQGNAAEMMYEKGTAKGGAYIHSAAECLPEATQHYSSPEPWLGFRLVVIFSQGGELGPQ